MSSNDKKRKFENFDITDQVSVAKLLKIMREAEEEYSAYWEQTLDTETEKLRREFRRNHIFGKKLNVKQLKKCQTKLECDLHTFTKERYLAYDVEFLIFKYKTLKEIAPNITAQELWRLQMESTLGSIQNVTDLKFQWELFPEDRLPAACYNNLTFVASLLIVGNFVTHPVAGFYRKHDDGFDAIEKDDNSDIIAHVKGKFPYIILDRTNEVPDSFGFTRCVAGVDDIFLNSVLYQNALEIGRDDTESMHRSAFMIAFTILHELCHFKIRNFHDQVGNLEHSPEGFVESGKCLELELFHGRIGFLGEDYEIEKLLICVESPRHLLELPVKNIDQWFHDQYWKSCKTQSDFIVDLNSMKVYKKKASETVSKELEAFCDGLDAFDRIRCATHFLKDPILPEKK
jgi:hypothetical protein